MADATLALGAGTATAEGRMHSLFQVGSCTRTWTPKFEVGDDGEASCPEGALCRSQLPSGISVVMKCGLSAGDDLLAKVKELVTDLIKDVIEKLQSRTRHTSTHVQHTSSTRPPNTPHITHHTLNVYIFTHLHMYTFTHVTLHTSNPTHDVTHMTLHT